MTIGSANLRDITQVIFFNCVYIDTYNAFLSAICVMVVLHFIHCYTDMLAG